jgi:hypothetical protein
MEKAGACENGRRGDGRIGLILEPEDLISHYQYMTAR